jgi:hypothetical protein
LRRLRLFRLLAAMFLRMNFGLVDELLALGELAFAREVGPAGEQ